ncbi:MAG TPA: sigma-70 family RNA polymerase sigma factor, partial [Ktedonobacteraceae bacterium]|nr:sigma-70 family RNA polymerase sigma factor [Ktedonobacteraceae bacterium]
MNAALLDSSPALMSTDTYVQSEELTDEAIMQAFYYNRSEWAIEQLYMRYKQYMYGVAYRILHDSYLAEDVIQDVFFTLWYKAISYQKELGSLKSWLQTIVRNRALDKVRSSVYREYQFAPLHTVTEPEQIGDRPEVWQVVWDDEQKHFIRKALGELSPEQRQAIELNYFAGYSHAEIAARLQ